MNITENFLPVYCYDSRDMADISGAVIHYISAKNVTPDDPFNLDSILQIFKDYSVSAHYLIDRQGAVIQLVPMPKRAYHAGKSIMDNRVGCNAFTIGIELMGGQGFDYLDVQMAALSHLLAELMVKYHFGMKKVKGHDEVRAAWNYANPKNRASVKIDPGPHFPWLDLTTTLNHIAV